MCEFALKLKRESIGGISRERSLPGSVEPSAPNRAGEAYLARDFPAGTDRYVVDSEGYRYLIVNGEVVLKDGKHTGTLPGHVIRGA